MKRQLKGLWVPIKFWELRFKDVKLRPLDRVLISEITHLSKNGPCRAGNQHFANLLDISTSTVSRVLNRLNDIGLISIAFIENSRHRRELRFREENPDIYYVKMKGNFSSKKDEKLLEKMTKNTEKNEGDFITQNDALEDGILLNQVAEDFTQDAFSTTQDGELTTQDAMHRIPLENNKNTFRYFLFKKKNKNQKEEIDFLESEISTEKSFCTAFENTDYARADLQYYFERVRVWAAAGNRRTDWLSVAQMFMLNDLRDEKLRLNPELRRYESKVVDPEQILRVVARRSRRRAERNRRNDSTQPPTSDSEDKG